MKTAVINSKVFMADGYRIDPDIHMSEGVAIRRVLNSLPYPLSTVGDNSERVFLGNIFSRVFVKDAEHGMPYLAASDTVLSNIETGRYLSNKQCAQLSNLILQKNWILVTCSGTLGNVTYTNELYENHIATHDLIRIIPNSSKVNKGTLYAFLVSKYGYYQITQSMFGGVVKHINDNQTKEIIVPVFPSEIQSIIDNNISRSAQLKETAHNSLKEALDLVEDFISESYKKEFYKSARVSVKDVISSLQYRLDPPAIMNDGVIHMRDVCSRMEHSTIGRINAKVYRPGIFKRNYVEDGIPYIKGSEIFLASPFLRCQKLSRTRTPFIDEMSLKAGQILITCAGSVGDIKLITKEYEDKRAIGSQDIIRLESYDDLYSKEYLFIYLQQPFVHEYIQSMKYGSVIERIEPFHVESIPVVKPTEELNDKIKELVSNYMECTYKAFVLEEKSVSLIEDSIEHPDKYNC